MPSDIVATSPSAAGGASRAVLADRLRERLLRMGARPWPWLALLVVLLAIQVGPWWHPTPDSVSYLSMGRSFASGEGMTNLGREQLYFSPGYSLLISPTFVFGERPFLAISLLHFGVSIVAMLGVYVWARQHAREGALLITALVFVNALVWIHYRRSLTEIPFLCAAVWTVLAMQWTLTATTLRAALLRALPTAGLLLAACLLRQAGATLAAGFGVALLCEIYARRMSFGRATTMLGLVSVPAVLALWVVVQNDLDVSAGGKTYLDGFVVADSSLVAQIVECVRLRVCDIGRILVPGMFKAHPPAGIWLNVNVVIYLLVSAIVAVGWWRLVRTRRDILAMAFPFYLGLYLTWPFEAGGRFLVPLVPLLVICVWFAVEPYVRHRLNILAWLVVLHLTAAVGYWGAVEVPRAIDYRDRWDSIDALAAAIDADQGSVAVVNLPLETRLMLELALDRRVIERASREELDVSVAWIVEPVSQPVGEEFVVYLNVDQLQLLSRSDTDGGVEAIRTARVPRANSPRRGSQPSGVRR